MKKRINTIKGKYIVQGGDDNTLKDNEIRINSDLTMTERVNGEIVNTSSSGSNQGGGGNSPFSWDWSQIGYTPENTVLQQQFEDDIAYSKSLAETFTPSNTSLHFKSKKRLRFVPLVDTSNVTDMSYMFSACTSLTTIPQLDTSNVTNMNRMFYGCSSLTTISLDTSNVTDMSYMFNSCSSLTTISLDTSNVTNMNSMFYGCTSLTTISLDTSNVTDMNSMFYGCTSLTTIPQLDTSNVTNMSNMFTSCYKLNFMLIKNIGKSTLTTYDFSGATNWGTSSDETRQSLIDSLITYSYDRATNGMASATIKLSTTTKALLTEGEIAQITAKGFTIA